MSKFITPLAVAGTVAAAGAGYYFWPEDKTVEEVGQKIEQVIAPDTPPMEFENSAEVCPKVEPEVRIVEKPVVKIVEKEVVRVVEKPVTKIVEKEIPKIIEREIIPDKKGCYVDWKNKRVIVISDDSTSIRCWTDWTNQKVYTRRRSIGGVEKHLY